MAGNAGNAGNVGNAGGVGAVNSSSLTPILPDRVDLPFVTVAEPPGKQIDKNRVNIDVYPVRRWGAEWRAWYALSEYTATGWASINVAPWDNKNTDQEINDLVVAARDERADALGEIVAQHDEFASYFLALLTMSPMGYPKTFRLMNLASIVGTFTVLHFKAGTQGAKGYAPRPRPSHICPALLPPVPVPGHPAYPSGHSTEAYLIAAVLNDVLSKAPQKSAMKIDLEALAWRIARNREIAGLHYPSDSLAGKQLAADILPYLQSTDEYKTVLQDARKEWK
jgi:membrane-associated phospholipid phosphatase